MSNLSSNRHSTKRASIVTKLPGISVEDMETQITVPIEKIMNTVPGVISSRSRTIFGLSIVSLIFEEKMDK